MQLTIVWPDGAITFAHINATRGLTRRDHSGASMRPAFIIANERPAPNVEQSAHLLATLRRRLSVLGALVPIGSPLARLEGPFIVDLEPGQHIVEAGPTLRDRFAAGAIAATYGATQYSSDAAVAARRAFEIADAMLAERERSKF